MYVYDCISSWGTRKEGYLSHLEPVWTTKNHHSISVTQFPSLITHHSFFHTHLATSFLFSSLNFSTLFMGPTPVSRYSVFFFFLVPNSPKLILLKKKKKNWAANPGKEKKRKKKPQTANANPGKEKEKEKKSQKVVKSCGCGSPMCV